MSATTLSTVAVPASFNMYAATSRFTITVHNLTTGQTVATKTAPRTLTPAATARRDSYPVPMTSLPGAPAVNDGDVLQARYSYQITGGIFRSSDPAESETAVAVS
ncbi:hypothetical protein ACTVZO_07430 [Streptomyces sp. IBSNAI002]|uniref:hypothetical protein n=1 Tax=Streptomyces sp. IBSNAI002 TaxID=3457500 RepID=UPI003FD07B84